MFSENTRQGCTLKSPMLVLFVITEVKKKEKVWCEIGEITKYRGDVNVINVNGDIIDDIPVIERCSVMDSSRKMRRGCG